MKITLYGGVNEVGGNKILLDDGESRIFLDFGMSFFTKNMYYEDFLQPRRTNGIGDFLELKIIPELKGLYRKDLLEKTGKPYEEPEYDCVFLSHAHLDHCAHASFIDESIPICCGETTKLYLEAISESSNRDMELEVLRFLRDNEEISRDIRTFRSFNKIKINDFEVKPVHVDHTMAGSYGFIVENGVKIAYTGDLRLSGPRKDMSEDFIKNAAGADVLITEGTSLMEKGYERAYPFEEGKVNSEREVEERCMERIEGHKGPVFVDLNFKDIDRVRTFFNIAKKCDRRFVVGTREACILKYLNMDKKLDAPELKDVKVYMKKKKSGSYCESDYYSWEREYMDSSWNAEDVKREQDRVLMVMSLYSISELIDIKPQNGLYIHSRSLPFDDEQEIDFRKLENWIAHFGLEQLHAHTSGHLRSDQLKEVINAISPGKVIPVHTLFPEGFRSMCDGLILPQVGKEITV